MSDHSSSSFTSALNEQENSHRPKANLFMHQADGGRLADNIVHFARVLRHAGLPIGTGKIFDAITAVEKLGLGNRKDFYWMLHSIFVSRHEESYIFTQAFHMFWRNPDYLQKMMHMMLPSFSGDKEPAKEKGNLAPRIREAFSQPKPSSPTPAVNMDEKKKDIIELDASMTYSKREKLAQKDFDEMTTEEVFLAKKMLHKLSLPIPPIKSRRYIPSTLKAKIDMRGSLQNMMRHGGDFHHICYKKPKILPPPLVVLCDISGSMENYSRMFLHFLHAITNNKTLRKHHPLKIHSFLFGTRLTPISRILQQKDPDEAIKQISATVNDWSGGTRIGATLHDFNKNWSRRVLSQNAWILLITDGLDRDNAVDIEKEMERLQKSAHKIIWLNPLLRYNKYEPKAQAAKILIKYADDFKAVHNLNSLEQLANILSMSHMTERSF